MLLCTHAHYTLHVTLFQYLINSVSRYHIKTCIYACRVCVCCAEGSNLTLPCHTLPFLSLVWQATIITPTLFYFYCYCFYSKTRNTNIDLLLLLLLLISFISDFSNRYRPVPFPLYVLHVYSGIPFNFFLFLSSSGVYVCLCAYESSVYCYVLAILNHE